MRESHRQEMMQLENENAQLANDLEELQENKKAQDAELAVVL